MIPVVIWEGSGGSARSEHVLRAMEEMDKEEVQVRHRPLPLISKGEEEAEEALDHRLTQDLRLRHRRINRRM